MELFANCLNYTSADVHMLAMSSDELKSDLLSLVDHFKEMKVGVVGDVMLDKYVSVEARKLSREAPVIVADYTGERFHPGGAANLALKISRLGAKVSLFGVVGRDEQSEILTNLLSQGNVESSGMVSGSKPTSLKTRIYLNKRQYLRIDREDPSDIDSETRSILLERIRNGFAGLKAIVISDHDKGTLTSDVISEVIKLSASQRVPVIARPKVKHLLDFVYSTSVLSSVKEASEAMDVPAINDSSLRNMGINLLNRLEAGSVFLWNHKNSMLFQRGAITYIPVASDGTSERIGLRDFITAVYSLCMAAGGTPIECAYLAVNAQYVYSGSADPGFSELVSAIKSPKSQGTEYKSVKVR
jgi:rfaE bifunctional protein kinase chain/domain